MSDSNPNLNSVSINNYYIKPETNKHAVLAGYAQLNNNNLTKHIQQVANNPTNYAQWEMDNPTYTIQRAATHSKQVVQQKTKHIAMGIQWDTVSQPSTPSSSICILSRVDELKFPVGRRLSGFENFFMNRRLDDFFSCCGNDTLAVRHCFENNQHDWTIESVRLYACTHYIISKLICFSEKFKFADHATHLHKLKNDYLKNITDLA